LTCQVSGGARCQVLGARCQVVHRVPAPPALHSSPGALLVLEPGTSYRPKGLRLSSVQDHIQIAHRCSRSCVAASSSMTRDHFVSIAPQPHTNLAQHQQRPSLGRGFLRMAAKYGTERPIPSMGPGVPLQMPDRGETHSIGFSHGPRHRPKAVPFPPLRSTYLRACLQTVGPALARSNAALGDPTTTDSAYVPSPKQRPLTLSHNSFSAGHIVFKKQAGCAFLSRSWKCVWPF
jgi:hypothetical protein